MKNVCTPTYPVVNSVVDVAEHLGLQPVDLTEELNSQVPAKGFQSLKAYCTFLFVCLFVCFYS